MSDSRKNGSLLAVEGVTLWRGERRLFQDLSFELATGEMLHITGPNGCGKTSLLRVICGLTLPETGAVRWRGEAISRTRVDFHGELAYIGHRESLKAELSPAENLVCDLGLRRPPDVALVDRALADVGLEAQRDIAVRGLSAGQKRRVSLARCIASGARLWVLDEPYTNLDVAGRELVDALMHRLLGEEGMVLLVAHQSHGVQGRITRRLEIEP
jgi:heme exporter protein A